MTAAAGSGLRSRKVDPKRRMQIYRFDQVDDLDESQSISRNIPQVATGVEKEEEEEHHLQAALISHTNIPTPDIIQEDLNYDNHYLSGFQIPKSLIKFSVSAEDAIGCLYNLSSQDKEWLDQLDPQIRDKLDDSLAEEAILLFDRCGADKVSGEPPEFDECQPSIDQNTAVAELGKEILETVYQYWKDRRYNKNHGKRLQHILKVSNFNIERRYECNSRFRSICVLPNQRDKGLPKSKEK